MTLAILIFNFYPLTAVMIVMLALLNDGAILSIAYDNVHYKDQPEAWNMRMVLGIATVLGVIGVVSAFVLFYLGERVFHLDRAHIQTLMYLKLSVAGHLTIFLTRTRGPLWSIRPAKILWMAVIGTQIVATLIAVYGLFMTPLGWGWAAFVWVYALLWFLLNDRVKLLAYRIFDPVKAEPKPEAKIVSKPETKTEPKPEAIVEPKRETKAEPKPEAKPEPKPEAKTQPRPEAKVEPKPETKAEPQPEAKTASDLTPQIATRAYELYEQQGRREGQSVQNWDKAEREIRKDEAKTEPTPEIKDKSKPENKVEAKTGPKVEPQPEAKADSKPEAKAEPKPETKTDSKPDAKEEPKAEAKKPSDLTPQLVKRVHELYEELGRKDVQAVEDLEKAERENREDEPDK